MCASTLLHTCAHTTSPPLTHTHTHVNPPPVQPHTHKYMNKCIGLHQLEEKRGEEYLSERANPAVENGGGGGMVCGYVTRKGVGRLYKTKLEQLAESIALKS